MKIIIICAKVQSEEQRTPTPFSMIGNKRKAKQKRGHDSDKLFGRVSTSISRLKKISEMVLNKIMEKINKINK
jgi:hypothetical protein